VGQEQISLSIENGAGIRGTYFHPQAALPILEWLCPSFKQEIYDATT
jgi:hypothetical protein